MLVLKDSIVVNLEEQRTKVIVSFIDGNFLLGWFDDSESGMCYNFSTGGLEVYPNFDTVLGFHSWVLRHGNLPLEKIYPNGTTLYVKGYPVGIAKDQWHDVDHETLIEWYSNFLITVAQPYDKVANVGGYLQTLLSHRVSGDDFLKGLAQDHSVSGYKLVNKYSGGWKLTYNEQPLTLEQFIREMLPNEVHHNVHYYSNADQLSSAWTSDVYYPNDNLQVAWKEYCDRLK